MIGKRLKKKNVTKNKIQKHTGRRSARMWPTHLHIQSLYTKVISLQHSARKVHFASYSGRQIAYSSFSEKRNVRYYASHSWNVHSLSFRVKMLQFKAGFLFFLRTVIALEEVTIVPWLIKQKCRSFFYLAILQTSNLQSAACAIKR